jgi:hypothetical protein
MRFGIERTSGEARGEGYVGYGGRLRNGGRLGNCGRLWEKRQVVELAGSITYLTLGEGRNWFPAYGGCLSAVEDAGVASSSVRVRRCVDQRMESNDDAPNGSLAYFALVEERNWFRARGHVFITAV